MKTGRKIRAVRKQRGLTLDELSALCGVSRDDLGLYERGRMTPRPGTVKKIAAALDVPIAAIRDGLGWTAPEPAERWETDGSAPLREGVLETVRESRGENFIPDETDISLLMESIKAAIPALVERMKDTRPETEIARELLAEVSGPAGADGASSAHQYDLTDEQWEQVKNLLPPENAGRGRAFKSNRLMLDGILYHMKSGTAWRSLPERFGRHQCVSGRLRLWERTGVWPPVLDKLAQLGVIEANLICSD